MAAEVLVRLKELLEAFNVDDLDRIMEIGGAEAAREAAQQCERHPRAGGDEVDELGRGNHLGHNGLHRDDGRGARLQVAVDRGQLAHEFARTADRQEWLTAVGRGAEHLYAFFSEEHDEVRPVPLHEQCYASAVPTLLTKSEEAGPVFLHRPSEEAARVVRRHGSAPYTSPGRDEFVAIESSAL